MKHGEELTFNKKVFVYETSLGQGGTGQTILVKDTTTDMLFTIKKFVPYDEKLRNDLYARFVDEIKILFLITHPNVVRIYNYYLYPEQKTGFIQMEYVHGVDIETHFILMDSNYDEIFIQLINGFNHLEQNGVLHRDIRPENIMVTNGGVVKIIDFGFGKKLDPKSNGAQSVMLNWPVSELPDEVANDGEYNHQSEVYFLGKLFKKIIEEGPGQFKYTSIVEKMVRTNPVFRYQSFEDITSDISSGSFVDLNFSPSEKSTYQRFAEDLLQHVVRLHSDFEPNYDISIILSNLEDVLRSCLLEKHIQDNWRLISCFIRPGYHYSPRKDIQVEVVREFYDMMKSKSDAVKKVILDNLYVRIYALPVGRDDDLPF